MKVKVNSLKLLSLMVLTGACQTKDKDGVTDDTTNVHVVAPVRKSPLQTEDETMTPAPDGFRWCLQTEDKFENYPDKIIGVYKTRDGECIPCIEGMVVESTDSVALIRDQAPRYPESVATKTLQELEENLKDNCDFKQATGTFPNIKQSRKIYY